ncbi:hypothetical protein DSM104299_03222 [Baekduia alba]|uniref:hypothetical protein n=1 Tax=Baekduia alba TaxID=2997333 RepID=UPI00233FC263|nr:hypothetical protein [Baekduia alba]WCB94485.1 hypothetical protein DSM104299_03222 [Baekduia alba]
MGLLEGKAMGLAWVGLAAVIAAFASLPALMQDLVLAAAALGALRFIGGTVRGGAARAREIHLAVTSDLPERMERQEAQMVRVNDRLDAGQLRFVAIEATLDVFATSERAAVRGALEATQRPRSARATDPGIRTGWRE